MEGLRKKRFCETVPFRSRMPNVMRGTPVGNERLHDLVDRFVARRGLSTPEVLGGRIRIEVSRDNACAPSEGPSPR